jgi:CheY-like chemotaxis protein
MTVKGPKNTNGGKERAEVRILLVEDNADAATAITRLLVVRGHRVQVAPNMAAALQLAEQAIFDLIICDLSLPDGDGRDLMRQIKERYDLPGICLTGFDSEDEIQRSKDAGFVAHVTKPPDMQWLEQLIAKIIPS